jgi:hypothetical protein
VSLSALDGFETLGISLHLLGGEDVDRMILAA